MLNIENINYNWLVSKHYRPARMLLEIYPIDNPLQQLEVEIIGDQVSVQINDALKWLDYALQKKWGTALLSHMKLRIDGSSVLELPHLFRDAQILAAGVGPYCRQPPQTAFQQQLNKQEVADAEQVLNLKWPYLLKELYITNGTIGTWGPDSGFFPIAAIGNFSITGTYIDFRRQYPSSEFWSAHPNYLPFLHWGTDVYSLIDCNSNLGAVYAFDTNLKNDNNDWADCCWLVNESLYDWINIWLESDTYGVSLWRDMYKIKGLLT